MTRFFSIPIVFLNFWVKFECFCDLWTQFMCVFRAISTKFACFFVSFDEICILFCDLLTIIFSFFYKISDLENVKNGVFLCFSYRRNLKFHFGTKYIFSQTYEKSFFRCRYAQQLRP